MRRFRPAALVGILVLAVAAPVLADDAPRTRQLAEGAASPPATIDQFAWIAGHWEGEAFGGIAEEVWSAPRGGAMMGMFRLIDGDEVGFYELMVLRQVGETVLLQLKHFHGDLKGWEEKDETIDFPLVALARDAAWFAGFTFERISADEMTLWVAISDHGETQEVPFRYRRMAP